MAIHECDPVFRRTERQACCVIFERRQRNGAIADVLIRPFTDFFVELRLFVDVDGTEFEFSIRKLAFFIDFRQFNAILP